MYGNIPAHSHHTARQMSVPVQENSYISKSYTSKSKSRLMMSEPEKRIPEKIQYGNTEQNSIQKINKEGSKKQKNKKIDIKKLIEQKQARQNVQKSRQQKVEPKNTQVFKLFQSTDHPNIDRCLFCGYIVFDENQTQRQARKLQHAKREHASYPYVDKRSVETQKNTDQYIKIAQDLIKFANHRDNRQLMEYVFGQSTPEPFKVYTEPIPVKPQLQKWANVVQDVFKVNF